MDYSFIIQEDGLFIAASCFDGEIILAEGPTTIARMTTKGVVVEEHTGVILGKKFYEGDRCYRVSN